MIYSHSTIFSQCRIPVILFIIKQFQNIILRIYIIIFFICYNHSLSSAICYRIQINICVTSYKHRLDPSIQHLGKNIHIPYIMVKHIKITQSAKFSKIICISYAKICRIVISTPHQMPRFMNSCSGICIVRHPDVNIEIYSICDYIIGCISFVCPIKITVIFRVSGIQYIHSIYEAISIRIIS